MLPLLSLVYYVLVAIVGIRSLVGVGCLLFVGVCCWWWWCCCVLLVYVVCLSSLLFGTDRCSFVVFGRCVSFFVVVVDVCCVC